MGSGGSKKLQEQELNANKGGDGGGGGGAPTGPIETIPLSKRDEALRAKIEEELINKRHTMLLLGTAGVGKSTISKQFVIAFGEGMTEEQIKAGANQVLQNLAQKINILAALANENEAPDSLLATASDEIQDALENIQQFNVDVEVEEVSEMKKALITVIKDPFWDKLNALQPVLTFEQEMEVNAADYFLGHLDRICQEEYLPDSEDLVHLRFPTTEIATMAFKFNKVTFSLKDVGGQIQYRDEWPTIFRDSHIVLFIVSIADYCKFSKNADEGDENSRNRLVEARTLLKDICHQKDLASRPFVLIFNKMDLFFENLKTKPLSSCKVFKGAEPKKDDEPHEEYVERCSNYVIQYFEKAVNSSDDPKLQHQCQSYMTSATDTEIFLNVMQKALVGVIDLLSSQMHSFGL